MNRINSINNKSRSLTIDPGASGDSFVQYDINATGKFRIGVDDSDSDAFVLSQGSALGTNNVFKMTSAGERTMPLQPSFLAYVNTYRDNITGDGTVYSIPWDVEAFDRGSDFASNAFTAPITGIYKFKLQILPTSLSSSYTSCYLQIVTTSDTYRSYICDPGNGMYVNAKLFFMEILIPMTAADTAITQFMVSGSSKAIDIQDNGGSGTIANRFSAVLIC